MAVDVSKAKEVAFTLVSNKNYKEKNKVSSLSSISSSNSRSNTLLISQASSLLKAVTTCSASKPVTTYSGLAIIVTFSPAITISKTVKFQIVPLLVLSAFKSKPRVKSFAQTTQANITQQAPRQSHIIVRVRVRSYLMRTFYVCYSLKRYFLIFLKLQLSLYTRPVTNFKTLELVKRKNLILD